MRNTDVYVGWDPKDAAAYHVLCHSILTRSRIPLSVTPLVKTQIRAYTRPRGLTESTEFSLTRFMVPWLSGYEGFSLFMDPDMLCRVDLSSLWRDVIKEPWRSVYVCKHDYVPKSTVKMDGRVQTKYPRKNWSSFMLFDNAKCRALTPEYVNQASALDLHRFAWLPDDQVGSLPLEWNWLVGEYPENPQAKILHYTLGGPWMDGYEDCDHAKDWTREAEEMISPSEAFHVQ